MKLTISIHILVLTLFLGCSLKTHAQKRVVEETILKDGVRLIEIKRKQ